MLNFKINETNINAFAEQVKQTIAYFGIAYVHGSGNIYAEKVNSDTHRDFTNAEQEEATYRVIFSNVNQVPDTLEGFKKAFFDAKQNEVTMPKETSKSERFILPKIEPVKEVIQKEESETIENSEQKVIKKGRPKA